MSSIQRRQFIIHGTAAAAAMTLRLRAARAEPTEVDLALVLAIDISRSISKDEHRLQLDGYAAAFRSADVIDAIGDGVIAVTLLQWAKKPPPMQAIGWTLIRDGASASRFASLIEAIPYTPENGTSIGGALGSAMHLLDQVAQRPLRRVIDVSGDGKSVDPDLLAVERDIAIARGITINGLPICEDGKTDVAEYYAAKVIGGPGAFLVVAKGFRSFSAAIRRKLTIEIAGSEPGRPGGAAEDPDERLFDKVIL
jgi:Protein of unknown function (DUF1194)